MRSIIFGRRTLQRFRALVTDPDGDIALSLVGEPNRQPPVTFAVKRSFPDGSVDCRHVALERNERMLDVMARMEIAHNFEKELELFGDFRPKLAWIHYNNIAGDWITLTCTDGGMEEATIGTCHSSLFGETWGCASSAKEIVMHFAQRATDKQTEVLRGLLSKPPQFKFDERASRDNYGVSFGEEKDASKLKSTLRVMERPAINDVTSSPYEELWNHVMVSYADDDNLFARSLCVVASLNTIANSMGIGKPMGVRNNRRTSTFHDAKAFIRTESSRIVESLNEGDIDWIEKWVFNLKASFWQIQLEDKEERQRNIEEAFADTRLNRYGVRIGQIKQYRFELSMYGDINNAKALHRVIWDRDCGMCQHCGGKLGRVDRLGDEPFQPVIDHIVPLARGGTNVIENLQLLCFKCNSVKATRLESDYSEQERANFYKNRRQR